MEKWQDSLVEYFEGKEKENDKQNIGVELEHFIIKKESGEAVSYSGDRGVRKILTCLKERFANSSVLKDDDFFGFSVPEFTVTLEPAAQLEISIMPLHDVKRVGEIYKIFSNALNDVISGFGYEALTCGCHPVCPVGDMELIPKRRYHLMDQYFKMAGTGGIEMMRGTASTQVSVDYYSEEDFRKKIQAAYYYSPVLKLLCDNASVFQGRSTDIHLKRTDIWRRVDNARCGILPGVFSRGYGFGDYAGFLGNMPPIFLKYGNDITDTADKTVSELFEGRSLSDQEIEHILSMAFPDVRLKQFIEIRFADSMPYEYMMAYSALIKGLMYREEALEYAAEEIRKTNMTEDFLRHTEDELMKKGWNACIYGQPAARAAKNVISLACDGLTDDEKKYIEAFEKVIYYGGIKEATGV